MMHKLFIFFFCLLPGLAFAQVLIPGTSAPQITAGPGITYNPQTGVISADPNAAVPPLVANAITAAAPPTCASIPLHDTLTGAVGSSAPCMARSDATRPSVVQRARVALASGGTFTVTWANATLFTSGDPVVQITPVAPAGSDIHCQIITTTNTSATGQCETTAASVSVLALGVVTINSASAAGTIVQLTAADPSQ